MNTYTLPNILNNPDVKLTYLINNQLYMFHLKWCDTFCLLDIYVIEDNKEIYLVKSRPLTINSDLIARVNDPDLITGSLFLVHRYRKNIEPVQNNFHSDYTFVYLAEGERNG